MKGVMRFRKKGKLSPRYIGPFEILKRIGEVAYKLALLPSLSAVHPVFHVSMLRKYYGDPSHVLDFITIQLDKDLTYIKESVAILDRQVRKLRSKNIASVNVQLRGHPVEEATWETEHDMWNRYPSIHHFRCMPTNSSRTGEVFEALSDLEKVFKALNWANRKNKQLNNSNQTWGIT
ncbi:uncharacterized protein [Nicotiana sylvestris]|uniref:uncharacterized protein n=1 Tax=Nicotiana sylvestris TaxID=4096 RepID=UPI00388C722E